MGTAGTKEWADHNVNCMQGCSHACRYCFAKKMAQRFRSRNPESWKNMAQAMKPPNKRTGQITYPKWAGRVMFPTSHDLTPETEACWRPTLGALLHAGNHVLVTTKPHLSVIERIIDLCDAFNYREQVQFRFTITAIDWGILQYWEPGAPPFTERLEALQYAFQHKYKTSVSIEPYLADPQPVVGEVRPYVTESIWIGVMNKRCVTRDDYAKVSHLYEPQMLQVLIDFYRNDPLVRFKDSIQNLMKVDVHGKAGAR